MNEPLHSEHYKPSARTYEQENYSTLELASPTHGVAERMRNGSAQMYAKPTASDEKVFVAANAGAVNREGSHDGLQVVQEKEVREHRICGLKRRIFLIIMAVLLVIIVAAAVGGGVAASKGGSSKNQNNALTSSPEGQKGNPNTPVGTINAPSSTVAVPVNAGLSAISWVTNGTTFRRIFYQHATTNGIMQSTWDSATNTSSTNIVTQPSVAVKKGTSIAATLLTHNLWDTHISFVDTNNTLNSVFSNDEIGSLWTHDDPLQEALDVHPNSKLANYWRACGNVANCVDNWLVAYQNSQGALRIRNGTFQGTARYKLDITPPVGTKMSMAQCGTDAPLILFWTQDVGNTAQVFGYQWDPSFKTPNNWANISSTPLAVIPAGAQISGFATTGCASYGVLFTPGDANSGIGRVTCRSGAASSCQVSPVLSAAVQPNLQGSTVLNRSTIAFSSDSLFALTSHDNKTVSVDGWSSVSGTSWQPLGVLDTDGI